MGRSTLTRRHFLAAGAGTLAAVTASQLVPLRREPGLAHGAATDPGTDGRVMRTVCEIAPGRLRGQVHAVRAPARPGATHGVRSGLPDGCSRSAWVPSFSTWAA